jgi:type II secretory pathway pseudopilin PulG
MSRRARRNEAGFSLLELVMVVGMLGLVVGAIYSTYLAHQKAASSQGEVAEVQQDLRVALDYLTRDLKMAGVLVPVGSTPIAAASGSPLFPTYSTTIMYNTASAEGRFARVDADTSAAAGDTAVQLTLEMQGNSASSPNCVDGFSAGDTLRLIRPVDGSQPLSGARTLTVSNLADNPSRGRPADTPPVPPKITLTKSDGFGDDTIHAGDMLAKISDSDPGTHPMTVAYFLVNGGVALNGFSCPQDARCLARRVNGGAGGADIIATNISALRFSYLDDSYHEAMVPASLSAVRAVRITLQGTTTRTAALSGGGRLRTVTTVVKLRNRR